MDNVTKLKGGFKMLIIYVYGLSFTIRRFVSGGRVTIHLKDARAFMRNFIVFL